LPESPRGSRRFLNGTLEDFAASASTQPPHTTPAPAGGRTQPFVSGSRPGRRQHGGGANVRHPTQRCRWVATYRDRVPTSRSGP
jgi:hypothetical protein